MISRGQICISSMLFQTTCCKLLIGIIIHVVFDFHIEGCISTKGKNTLDTELMTKHDI